MGCWTAKAQHLPPDLTPAWHVHVHKHAHACGHLCRALSVREVVVGCQQVAAALGYLHARGIIHHDVRQANILQTPGGRSWQLVDCELSGAGCVPCHATQFACTTSPACTSPLLSGCLAACRTTSCMHATATPCWQSSLWYHSFGRAACGTAGHDHDHGAAWQQCMPSTYSLLDVLVQMHPRSGAP